MDERVFEEIIRPFGSYERFRKRVEDIKLELELMRRGGRSPEEIFLELYRAWGGST